MLIAFNQTLAIMRFTREFNSAQLLNLKENNMNKKQQGLTIIEILIALLIGAIVIAGVVNILSSTIRKERLLSAEAEMQETLSYANNRLSFIFKESLSSPCGSLENMLATDINPTVSKLKTALIDNPNGGGGKVPQDINIILQAANARTAVIGQNDFPMLMPGIAGAKNSAGTSIEPLDRNSRPFSESLPNIVPDSEYLIAMEISEKVIINSTDINGVGGGQDAGGIMSSLTAIPTSNIETGVDSVRVPFIITDCNQADIFKANANVTANSIPVANDLAFHAYYKPNESIISPVNFFAYYIAQDPTTGVFQFRRRNLNLDLPMPASAGSPATPASLAASQTLVESVTNLAFDWGLGAPGQATAQAYFSTNDILQNSASIGNFRRNVISVRTTITVQPINNAYLASEMNRSGSTTTVTTQALSRSTTNTYTIRNKMSRI